MKTFKDLGIPDTIEQDEEVFVGEKIGVYKILNRQIAVHDYRIKDSKQFTGKCLWLQISIGEIKRVVFTSGKKLIKKISSVKKEDLPFTTTIIELDNKMLDFS